MASKEGAAFIDQGPGVTVSCPPPSLAQRLLWEACLCWPQMHQGKVHSLFRWMHGPRSGRVHKWCIKKKKKVSGLSGLWSLERKGRGLLDYAVPDMVNIDWKDWSWSSNTWATWCEELTHWKRPWCWGRLRAGGEGDDIGWDGRMASPIRWTWVWASSGG